MRKEMKKCRVKSTRGWASGRPGKGGPAARPYCVGTGWLIETVGGNGVFDNSVSPFLCGASDTSVVGATRREAHPRPPRGLHCTLRSLLCTYAPFPPAHTPSFSVIITEKISPHKKCSSKNSPFYYHFYYYNGENCAVFCKIMSFSPWTGETGKTALNRHISA